VLEQEIAKHYFHGSLLAEIRTALLAQHHSLTELTINDLAAIDEFHVGGRQASEHFFASLHFKANDQVLDIGCGLGGGARLVAEMFQAKVQGIDLNIEYVETGNVISTWLNLANKVQLQQASALTLPFENNNFTKAYMMHVGMNINDKTLLFKEVNRVLKDEGLLGIYDILRFTDKALSYPLPWAENENHSAIANLADYKKALKRTGFEIVAVNNRQQFAVSFFKKLRAKKHLEIKTNQQLPLGLHTLMKTNSNLKMANMLSNIEQGFMAPIEIIVRKING